CLRPEIGKVEIAPFAYMRGRTFENAVVILDAARRISHGPALGRCCCRHRCCRRRNRGLSPCLYRAERYQS
ncbi:hypothetical protein FK514_30570, partial [Klebsiella pneumoniae]|nr:hypothetical protein [Klebsiella pneumoniae]